MSDLDSPSIAFNNAFNAGQNVTDTWRKNQAMNALTSIYGPIAGDPADALSLQTYGQNQQMNPLLVQQQQLKNAADQETNSFNALNDPLKTQQNQQTITTNNQTIASNAQKLSIAQAQQVHGVLSGALSSLGQAAQGVTDPNQLGALWDTQVPAVARLTGMDPATAQKLLAPERAQFVQGGGAAIPQIQSTLDSAMLGALSPQDRVNFATAQAKLSGTQGANDLTQAKIALTNAQTAKAQNDVTANQAKAANLDRAYELINTTVQNGIDQAQEAQKLLPDVGQPWVGSAQWREFRAWADPNSPEGQLASRLSSLRATLQNAERDAQKWTGVPNGRSTVMSLKAAEQSFGALEVGTDPKIIRESLDRATKALQGFKIGAAANAANAAAAGKQPPAPSGAAAPAPATGSGQVFDYSNYSPTR